MFCDLVISKFNSCEKKFEILFLSCSCELSHKERKQIVRKHKSSVKKESLAQQRRDKYCFLGTERKQQLISKSAEKYKTMDRHKKEQLLSRTAEKYRNMDQQAKKTNLFPKILKDTKTSIRLWSHKKKKNFFQNMLKNIGLCMLEISDNFLTI